MPNDIVLRTYLIPSNEYKVRIFNTQMNAFVKALLRGKPMPRWIWVTEVSSISSYNSPSSQNWLINGQILIDATGNAFTPDFLAFHYISGTRGVLATMKPEHNTIEQALKGIWINNNEVQYNGWVR